MTSCTSDTPTGLEVYVTGGLGFNADFEEVFGDIDVKVLLVTVVLVVVLLLLIYRSPVIALIPLVVVFIAYTIARGLVYLYAESGATVSDNGTTILVVLMFGVGTDYCLLLVSRYREELRRHEDKHDAMELAIRRSGPAILGQRADRGADHARAARRRHRQHPFARPGVGARRDRRLRGRAHPAAGAAHRHRSPRLLAAPPHRRLPARRRRRASARASGAASVSASSGARAWRWPRRSSCSASAASGLLAYKEDYSVQNFFKEPTESADGFTVMQQAFPAGALVPTTVLVERRDGAVTDEDVAAVREQAQAVDGVAAVGAGEERSTDGRVARLTLVFDDDPFETAALERIEVLRDRVHPAAPEGGRVLVGDGSAVQADFNQAAARDLELIVPLALLVIFAILAVLLRALVAPLLLIASVVVSFLGTLGLSIAFFIHVIGDTGVDNSLPTYAFIFLVALGIDYTIFLMSRVREEAARARHARGDAARAGRHRARDHQRGHHPGRHVRRPAHAAGDVHLRPRLHRRRSGSCSTPSSCGRSWSRRSWSWSATACGGRRPRAADQYFSSELPRRCALSRSQSR